MISSATCRDLRDRVRLLRPLKDKRGAADHPPGYPQHHPYNLNGFALPGLSGQNLGGYGSGYFLPPSLNSGLGHGFNLPQGSGYSSSSLFTPSKTGPVTFVDQGPSTNPNLYVTAMMQDLAKYFGSGSSKLQFVLGSPSSQKAQPSSYQNPLTTSDSSNGISGAYILASPGHESAYIIPVSSQSASSSSHSLPSTYSQQSSSYGSSHVGLSSNSADSSSYSLPISPSSHSALSGSKRYVPSSSAGSVYATANSNPHTSAASYASSGMSYDKTNSPTYSANAIPNSSAYTTIPKSYDAVSPSYSVANYPSSSNYPGYTTSYSGAGVAYAPQQAAEPSQAIAPQTYSKSVSSYYASPSASQQDSSSGYGSQTSDYSNTQVTYSGSAESPSHSSLVAQYVNYPSEKSADNSGSSSSNYDTISYSISGGKYS